MICINVSDFYVLFKTLLVHMTANVRSLTGHFGRYFELSLQHDVVETTFDICEIVIEIIMPKNAFQSLGVMLPSKMTER